MSSVFTGRQAFYHHLLHKKHGEGLVADLQQNNIEHKIGSMAHEDYFTKYLREGEGLDKLLSAVKAICAYEKPEYNIVVSSLTVPYLRGINDFSLQHSSDNINRVVVVFEEFPKEGADALKGGDNESINGHFMLLWHFPSTFKARKNSKDKFCLFDPFGRERGEGDPTNSYYQKGKGMDYQSPHSNTCALWSIFALIQFCLQVARIPNITPVEYDGNPNKLDEKPFQIAHGQQFRKNERALYVYLIKNWFIFQPRIQQQRPFAPPEE